MQSRHVIAKVEDYEPFIGEEAVERIVAKGRHLAGRSVAHVNSTYFGGGVAEMLASLTLLMRSLGLDAEWRAIQGPPDFFSITKKMHNALQGAPIRLTDIKKEIYEEVAFQNATRNRFDHDFVVVHDPQPLPLVQFSRKRGPWVWRCHVDMAQPSHEIWKYLGQFVEQYDAVITSAEEYRQPWRVPQLVFQPAIDPFSIINRELPEGEVDRRLHHYGVPDGSRRSSCRCRGSIAGRIPKASSAPSRSLGGSATARWCSSATSPPTTRRDLRSTSRCLRLKEERVLILSGEDTSFVNALQRRAAVVLQKSLREGFGLTVTEAMWKRTPVIGGNVGGIRYQIDDGVNGFLVSSVEETADRLVLLLSDEELRQRMGEAAREKVRQRFLMTRYLEQYLDLLDGFETRYRLRPEVLGLSARTEASEPASLLTH